MVERLASGERYVYVLLRWHGDGSSEIIEVFESETMARQAAKVLIKATGRTSDDYAVEITRLVPDPTKDADK